MSSGRDMMSLNCLLEIGVGSCVYESGVREESRLG